MGTLLSWVLDWSVADFAASLRLSSPSDMALSDFQATPKGVRRFVRISTDRMAIGLAGEIVDRIAKTGDVNSHQAKGLVMMVERLMRIPKEQAVFTFRWSISTDKRGPS